MRPDVLSKIKNHILFILIFLLPDILFGFWNPNFAVCGSIKTIFILSLFGLILSMTPKIKYVIIAICVFAVMQIVQFGAMFYFGRYLSPLAIDLMFEEYKEVIDEGFNTFGDFFYV